MTLLVKRGNLNKMSEKANYTGLDNPIEPVLTGRI